MRAYKANMIPGGVTPTINVSQYDNDYAVTVTLIEGAEIYTPPVGATIRVEGTKPDGHGFEYACTYQGNVVTMPIYTQMTVVAGRFPIELVVYQSGLRVGSCNIVFAVEKAPLGEDTDISETVIPDIIAGAQAQADAAQEAAETAQEAAAQVLSSQIVTEASGSIASFSDGADDIPMQSVVAEITPVQSGSGDPSPDNIRPISGRTGMTVTRAGKNLLNPSSATSRTVSGVTFTKNADGSITASGTATATIWYDIISNNENAVYFPAGSYILHPTYNSNIDIRVAKVGSSTAIASAKQTAVPFTLTEGAKLYALMVVTNGTTVNQTFYPMVTPSAISDSTYAPYNATEIPITWETEAGTVYGGTLNVTTGVLTVTHVFVSLFGIQYYWQKSGVYNGSFYISSANFANEYNVPFIKTFAPFVCSHAKTVERIADYQFGCCYMDSSLSLWLLPADSTVDDFRNYLNAQVDAGTPVQVCCQLATPQTYQLTPTEVRTILGGNTIYTDAGAVSVEYIADTKLYIDNKIAELQALILEN